MSKIIKITQEQEKFLIEQKGILFEYYSQASSPKYDSHILGNIQIWVYGNDRQNFTPHCHVMLADKSIEFEVSLLDWEIINVKRPNNISCDWSSFNEFKKPFFAWIERINRLKMKNKIMLFMLWDINNPNNTLSDFIERNNINIIDEDLIEYIED